MFCHPWYCNRGPGWLSSQGVLQSDRRKISAQIGNFWRVRLQKQPDAWSEGVLLPLAFDCLCHKGVLPSMVLQSGTRIAVKPGCFCNLTDPTKSQPKSATFGGCDSRNNLMPGRRVSRSHLSLIVVPQRCSVIHGIAIRDQDGCQALVLIGNVWVMSHPLSLRWSPFNQTSEAWLFHFFML